MKVKSKIFKGIEYVQLSELPKEQLETLSQTLNKDLIIKILIGGKVHNDCIQFRDYLNWYENVYKTPSNKSVEAIKKQKTEPANLVSNN